MTFLERTTDARKFRHWEGNMEADYIYTSGVAGEKFFVALRDEGDHPGQLTLRDASGHRFVQARATSSAAEMGTDVEFRVMPNNEDGRWHGESSRTAAKLLRAALPIRSRRGGLASCYPISFAFRAASPAC